MSPAKLFVALALSIAATLGLLLLAGYELLDSAMTYTYGTDDGGRHRAVLETYARTLSADSALNPEQMATLLNAELAAHPMLKNLSIYCSASGRYCDSDFHGDDHWRQERPPPRCDGPFVVFDDSAQQFAVQRSED